MYTLTSRTHTHTKIMAERAAVGEKHARSGEYDQYAIFKRKVVMEKEKMDHEIWLQEARIRSEANDQEHKITSKEQEIKLIVTSLAGFNEIHDLVESSLHKLRVTSSVDQCATLMVYESINNNKLLRMTVLNRLTKDASKIMLNGEQEEEDDMRAKPLSISALMHEYNIKDDKNKRIAKKIGIAAAKLYFDKWGDEPGSYRYCEEDRSLMVEAMKSVTG